MRPQQVTVDSQTISAPILVNWRERNFKLGVQIGIAAGSTLTYNVQTSSDDPEDFIDADKYGTDASWVNVSDLNNLTTSDSAVIEYPVRAIRLEVTAFTTGSATMIVLQAT